MRCIDLLPLSSGFPPSNIAQQTTPSNTFLTSSLLQITMKLFAALASLAVVAANPFAATTENSAKAAYMSKLMRGARPTANSQLPRRLDQNAEYEVDLTPYSVKFEQCQFVKTFDEEVAAEGETILATKRFVLFRLCPNSSCGSCNYNYGEYLIDLDTYLEATVGYFQNYQEEMCNACNECYNNQNQDGDANGDNANRKLQQYNVNCDSCYNECQKIANMEENGYIDATTFLECTMIYAPEDDSVQALYAGPICAGNGQKIKIGVFEDDQCLNQVNKDVDDYLVSNQGNPAMLSHALLKMTYLDTCISCKEPENYDENNANDQADADQVIELCENLYDAAAKCESSHGFSSGYANYYEYENQLANEEVVCEFMQSLKTGTYDEQGEIIVTGASKVGGGSATTGGQKFALTFFILGTVGLAVYAAVLHSKLTKGGRADLSSSGGAMA